MSIFADTRVVLRSLARRPAMVAAILVTLALGIGVNTAIFTVIEAVILRPIAVKDPKQLVAIYTGTEQTPYGGSSFALYRALASRASTLIGVGAFWTARLPLISGEDTQDVLVTLVSENYFTVLGSQPGIGRLPSSSDMRAASGNTVVVLSDAFWRSHFGADPAVLGKQIVFGGQPFTVIGVARPTFHGTDLTAIPDMWMPLSVLPLLHLDLLLQGGQLNEGMPIFAIFARLAPKVDRTRAAAEIAHIAQTVAQDAREAGMTSAFAPALRGARQAVSVVPLSDAASAVRDRGSLLRFLGILMAVAVLTLLLACMNVANLLLVRGRERAKDLGVRMALGAGSRQIAQYLLVESFLLALAGGIAGVAVAAATIRAFAGFRLPGNIAVTPLNLGIRAPVLLFAAGISIVTVLLSGLQPMLRAIRVDVVNVLRGRTGQSGRRGRAGLLPIQVAMSLVALVDASLLLRSIQAGLDTNIGFDPRGIVAVTIRYRFEGKYAESVQQYESVVTQLKRSPDVVAAAAATHVPLGAYDVRPVGIGPIVDGGTSRTAVMMGVNHVSEDYFDVLSVRVLRGRRFTDQDRAGATRTIILNESAERALYAGGSAVGKMVHAPWFGPIQFTYQVVGVVRDTKYGALQDAGVPFAFIPLAQEEAAPRNVTILARSRQPAATLETIKRTIRAVAPDRKLARSGSLAFPGPPARFLSDQILNLLAPQRFGASLLAAFGVLALCVSAVGIYGHVAYTVSQRTSEIGIRMALGARAIDILRVVSFDAGIAIAIGAFVGIVAAALTSKILESLLYGVGATDPLAFASALGVTVAMATVATLIPAWRAVRIDPAGAIRSSS